jgi:hypothetical protein
MERIIKEEIARIGELMNVQILKESEYSECERFSDNKQKRFVCKKIASLKGWLHKDDGLGLKRIINNKTEELKTDVPDSLKQQFIKGAELLQSLGKISEKQKEYFINNKVNSSKLVYINGEWQPINKLNTNYSDLSELITDLIYKGGENAKTTIQSIINNPTEGLKKIKPYIGRLVDKYFEDPNVLLDYTKNIQRASAIGESAENRIKETLEDMGFESEYSGGNGDLIDMTFGTDLIMTHPTHGTKTIQVKNSERAWDRKDAYSYVDWVIIANPFTIYDNKTKKPIQI